MLHSLIIFDHRYTLQSLYTAIDHQLRDGLVVQHEFDRMRYVVRTLFDLKLQLHAIEASLPLPADVVEHTIALMLDLYSEGILSRSLFICVCTHLLSPWETTTNEHLYKVVNCVNCVNMYI